MKNISGVYGLILLLGALSLASRALRRRIWRMCGWAPRTRRISVRRRRFFWISLGNSLLELAAIDLALLGLFVAELLTGEMVGWRFWAAVTLLTGLMSTLAFAMWRAAPQPPFGLFARHGIDIDVLLADAHMAKTADGTWLYVDKDWYVAIRPGVACALYAPLINPLCPFQSVYRHGLRTVYSYCTLLYVARDGAEVRTRFADVNGQLNRWLKIHGFQLC